MEQEKLTNDSSFDLEFIKNFERFILNYQRKLDDKDNELLLLRQMLLQNSKMALMGEMMDSISHQWKQPLGIISLQSMYMNHLLADEDIDNKLFSRYTTNISNQIKHMMETMNEFSNFFRPSYNIEEIELSELITSVALLIKDELIKNNVSLNFVNKNKVYLQANKNDIKHLLLTLVDNAKEEMVNSNVEISARVITIDYKVREEKIEIYVKDNGKGIEETLVCKIFQPHFTTKSMKNGTGMGLYLCKMIVQKYNGTIDVYNDNGAVFKVVL